MKKILILTILVSIFTVQIPSASAMNLKYQEGTNIVAILNPSKSEFLQALVKMSTSQDTKQYEKILNDIILRKVNTEIIYTDSHIVGKINGTEADFQRLINSGNILNTSNIKGIDIYQLDSSEYFAYINRNIIESNTEQGILDYSDQKFSVNSNISISPNQYYTNSFLTIIFDGNEMLENIGIKTMMFEFFQKSEQEFTFRSNIKLNKSIQNNIGKFTFKPSIYKMVSSRDLLFYGEYNNLEEHMKDMDFEINKKSIQVLFQFLKGKSAFFIQFINQPEGVLQRVTIVSEIRSEVDVQQLIRKISKNINKGDEFITTKDGFTLKTVFNLENTIFTGQIIDGYFVISNNPNIKKSFGKDNREVIDIGNSKGKNIIGLIYMDPSKMNRLRNSPKINGKIMNILAGLTSIKDVVGYVTINGPLEEELVLNFRANWMVLLNKLQKYLK